MKLLLNQLHSSSGYFFYVFIGEYLLHRELNDSPLEPFFFLDFLLAVMLPLTIYALVVMLTICGMPNRNGGSSTSDTGSAVLLRDGWSDAEARAKDSENVFKRAEKKMLKLVLRICRDLGGLTLKLSDIDMKFTRRNYEAIQSKSQVLISMLQEPKIHPQLAFQHSGMFSDAESAYTMSMKYYEEQQEKAAELAKKTTPDDSGDDDNDPDNNDI